MIKDKHIADMDGVNKIMRHAHARGHALEEEDCRDAEKRLPICEHFSPVYMYHALDFLHGSTTGDVNYDGR